MAGDTSVSVAEAARLLGTDPRTVRRYIETRALAAYSTPGGHWRIPRAGLDEILQGASRPSATAPLGSSLAAAKAQVEALNLEIAATKATRTLQQLKEEEEEAKRRKAEAARAEENETRRTQQEDRRERQQRRLEYEREQAAARARRDFEDEKLGLALSVLPQGVPEDLVLDVAEAIRQKLPELYQSTDDVVDRIVIAIARKLSRPYVRRQEAGKATAEAQKELSFLARSYGGSPLTEWELRAQDLAMEAINKLPETATFHDMDVAARAAGKHVACEYEHSYNVRNVLLGLLPHSGPEKRTQAEKAVQDAFAPLPVGASDATFNTARDIVLVPFVAAEAEAKAAHEAAAAKAQVEGQADMYLYCVEPYLAQLEAAANGYDFEGERHKYAEKIKQEIRADLIADLPLDLTAGRKRVEELVDTWLTAHCTETNPEPDLRPGKSHPR